MSGLWKAIDQAIDRKNGVDTTTQTQPRDYHSGTGVQSVRQSADMTYSEARHRAILSRPTWEKRLLIGTYIFPFVLGLYGAILAPYWFVTQIIEGAFSGSMMMLVVWIPVRLHTNSRARRLMYSTATTPATKSKFARVVDGAFQESWHLTFGEDELVFTDPKNGHVMRGGYKRIRDGSDLSFETIQYARGKDGKPSSDFAFPDEFIAKNMVARVTIPAQLADAKVSFANHFINILNDRVKLPNIVTWHMVWKNAEGAIFPLLRPTLPDMVGFGNFFDGRYQTYPKVFLGLGAGKKPMFVDFHEHAHLMMAGTTGGGKSNQLNVMLVSLLLERYFGQREIHIWLVDMKRVELGFYRDYVDGVLTNDESAFEVINFFSRKMMERYEYMEANGIRNFLHSDMKDEYFLVVDEAAQLFGNFSESKQKKEAREAAYDSFSKVMALGRAAGFHILLATQRPDSESINLRERELMGWRVAGKLTSAMSSSMALGEQDHAATELDGTKGRMVVKKIGTQAEQYQAVYLPDEELFDILRHFDDKPQPKRIEIDNTVTNTKKFTHDDVFEPFVFESPKPPKIEKKNDDSKPSINKKEEDFGFTGDLENVVGDTVSSENVKKKKHIEGLMYDENDQISGREPLADPISGEVVIPPEPKRALRKVRISDVEEELKKFVGLESLKKEMLDYSKIIQIQKQREEQGLPASKMSYHAMFLGNPGTGKTTFARILGDIFVASGVLKLGHIVEVDRSQLVGGYIGHTAKITYAKCVQAMDGVLLVDEAYELFSKSGANDSSGSESLNAIMKFMEDFRDRIVVVFAGYPAETRKLYTINPGMRSRIGKEFVFEDYSDMEMVKIFIEYARQNQYRIEPDTLSSAANYITAVASPLRGTKEFANARLVRNVWEEVVRRQSLRLSSMKKKDIDRDALTTILPEDFPPLPSDSEGGWTV
jgi:AAA+ superfamily predicted ATPase/energy-coupling factor transporter ATP-binding protein EcfA2